MVRVPLSLLPRRRITDATATPLRADGPARLLTGFLLCLDTIDPAAAADLVPHALGLLDTAFGWAAGRTAGETSQLAMIGERVRRFVRDHAADPDLDVDQVAAGCRIARRTLFRALAGDEPARTGSRCVSSGRSRFRRIPRATRR